MTFPKSEPRAHYVSVVIATLGGPTLPATINALNRGTVVPFEILICIPVEHAHAIKPPFAQNVKLVVTECRGQVAQRAIGFQHASQEFVLQMDDDMTPATDCLEQLLEAIQTEDKAAIAPILVDVTTQQSFYAATRPNEGILNKFYYWLMNGRAGYREGVIMLSGIPVGVIPDLNIHELRRAEWLPGGCIMHKKVNLIVSNYLPFTGKAYCEDLIHSHLLTCNGVHLYVAPKAKCGSDLIENSSEGLGDFLRRIKSEIAIRKYFMSLANRKMMRMYVFYAMVLFKFGLGNIFRWTSIKVLHDNSSGK